MIKERVVLVAIAIEPAHLISHLNELALQVRQDQAREPAPHFTVGATLLLNLEEEATIIGLSANRIFRVLATLRQVAISILIWLDPQQESKLGLIVQSTWVAQAQAALMQALARTMP